MKNLQNTRHSELIIYKSSATYVLSGTTGKWRVFSSFINYNWRVFSNDLPKNVAAHCLATSLSH
jgi:hypothetical protein